LNKLYDIGSKLFPVKILVDEMWKKISKTKGEQIPKLLRIYSKYLIDIFNDKQQGTELLERAGKLENTYHNKRDFSVNDVSDLHVDGQEDGMVFMTMDEVNQNKMKYFLLRVNFSFRFFSRTGWDR